MLHWALKYPSLKGTPVFEARLSLANDLILLIDELRREMLVSNLRNKASVYQIAKKPKVQSILERVAERIREAHRKIADHLMEEMLKKEK
jgi:hypothetical protein